MGSGEQKLPERRAGLLRLARLSARIARARFQGPARVCVRAGAADAKSRACWRALPGGGRALELLALPALLAPRAGAELEGGLAGLIAGAREGPSYPAAPPSRPAKVLLFRQLLEAPGKEGCERFNQGALYLASSLRSAGVPVVLSRLRISRFTRDPGQARELEELLESHPDIGLVALSLYDAFFEDAARLVEFLRSRLGARIAAGALMPTREPEAVLAHLPGVDWVGRGAGETVLPRLAAVAGGCPRGPLDDCARGALLALDGVLAAEDDRSAVWAGAESVLRVESLDDSALDLSFLERSDVESGAVFCLSRGCASACRFCTSVDQGRFHGKSAASVAGLLAAYGRRLKQLYARWSEVPPAAFSIGFYDDDFLADRERALAVLDALRRSPFGLRFIQTGIRSLLRPTGESADEALLDALAQTFAPKLGRVEAGGDPQLYLGTESFCDAELARLGKGYGARQVETAVRALSRRGLRQAHHFIASNARTRPEDVIESLSRVASLRAQCGEPFSLLEPVISHLVSFPGTPILRSLEREGLAGQVERRALLALPGFPEYDYPLNERDRPEDPDVANWSASLAGRRGLDWRAELEELLFEWLVRSERLAAAGVEAPRAARLRRAVDRHALGPAAEASGRC